MFLVLILMLALRFACVFVFALLHAARAVDQDDDNAHGEEEVDEHARAAVHDVTALSASSPTVAGALQAPSRALARRV